MKFSPLEAISPVDGRYRRATASLADYFSEGALIKYRVLVEVEYFISLCEMPLPQLSGVDPKTFKALRDIYKHFSVADADHVKGIEKVTNHDVKAVEYYLKEICTEWKYNELMIQSPLSDVCGELCLFYLYHKCRNIPLDKILEKFKKKNLDENDVIARNFVFKKFKFKVLIYH